MSLAPDHAAFLEAHAVDLGLAEQLGVRSVSSRAELPEGTEKEFAQHVPGILLPWTSPDGKRVSYQLRPDCPLMDEDDKPIKYRFRTDVPSVLWAVRHNPHAMKILIVEGSKQCLVAALYAPPEFAVYGIAGCWGWRHRKAPIADLEIVEGKEVYCLFDADAATNRQVYNAGAELSAALKTEGASKVRWVHIPVGDTSGLDDWLAMRHPNKRAVYLKRVIDDATDKIAERKPSAKAKPKRGAVIPFESGRPRVYVDDDSLIVADTLVKYLLKKWDGRELFCHGGVLSLLNGTKRMHPLDRDAFNDLLMKTVITVVDVGGEPKAQAPSVYILGAVHSARYKEFTPLDRITTVPFARKGGTICTSRGYDEQSQALLIPSNDLEGIEVPEHPTRDEVQAAVSLLLDDWLSDMPFPDQASRANTLGLVLTYFIRGLVNVVPLAVITGLQMGVGKNLLADCISIVALGEPVIPRSFNDDDDENRKALLAAFRAGEPAVVWDEAHILQGTNLARALTAETYADRILGVSREAQFPNRMVWTALGNQVQVLGDVGRRVYPISLAPSCPNPQDRVNDMFRHPDLPGWTREHRAELVVACLTLVRAWYDAGEPVNFPINFGSFEQWQRMVGGILSHAGVPDFLANREHWRRTHDYVGQHWEAHMNWLASWAAEIDFTVRRVKDEALANVADYEGPPGLEDTSARGYTRELGKAYARRIDVWCAGYQLVRIGTGSTGAAKWRLVRVEPDSVPIDRIVPHTPLPTDITEIKENVSVPHTYARSVSTRTHTRQIGGSGNAVFDVSDGETVIFDLETASASELFTRGDDFVRLGCYQVGVEPGDMPVEPTTDWPALVHRLHEAAVVSGHNICSFDLPALAKHHGLRMHEVAKRAFDTLIAARYIDPPQARQHGRDFSRRYDLDSLIKKYVDPDRGKSTSLSELSKEHGGYDKIPIDDPKYREYLARDVELSASLYVHLNRALDDPAYREEHKLPATLPDNARAYVAREHAVAAIASQVSLNGFRVDREFLDDKLRRNEATRRAAILTLWQRFKIPPSWVSNADLLSEGEELQAREAADLHIKRKSPLAARDGKEALRNALDERWVTNYWITDKTGVIAESREAMNHVAAAYAETATWDHTTSVSAQLPTVPNPTNQAAEIRTICKLVAAVVSLRSVYGTVNKALAPGEDRVYPSVSMKQSTGRWSLSRPGLTVMGKRGGRWHEREMFLADPGHVVIAIDLSQVDMRAIAGLSGDQRYIDMLMHDDPHAEIAQLLFGNQKLREIAKPIGHGWNYGRGIKAISESNEIDPELVKQFDREMKERFPRLVEWREEVRARAADGMLLDNGWGRLMRPEPSRSHTQGPALMGQGAARDIMMEGLLRLPEEYLPMLRAQVHDEIVMSVPAADARDIQDHVIQCMTFEWKSVPIVAEGGPVDRVSWGQVYNKDYSK